MELHGNIPVIDVMPTPGNPRAIELIWRELESIPAALENIILERIREDFCGRQLTPQTLADMESTVKMLLQYFVNTNQLYWDIWHNRWEFE